ncbi:hypothetical protein M9H77_23546 [Catharanthus roseus]|uniref:Uncharacterized protein n=1 Tax=Catharanthus roseus TaxID=4058 RepID=A0ACC0AXR2_CATRO|nr:hypothetical protein M9H77_23546 [Catharanthus roseus]
MKPKKKCSLAVNKSYYPWIPGTWQQGNWLIGSTSDHHLGKYALLGDDIIIEDPRVADVCQSVINALGVTISLPKSLILDIAGREFAKRFRICYGDWICRPLKYVWALPTLATHLVYPGQLHICHYLDSKRVASTVPMSEDLIAQVPVSEPSEPDVLETDD